MSQALAPQVSVFDLAEANLTPDPDNMNQHNKKNLDAIRQSVEEVGFARSIVIDESGMIMAGNGTFEIAKEKGAKILIVDVDDDNTVVAVRKKGLSKLEKHRAGLWDNETARLATRNKEAMKRVATENPDQMIMEGIISEKDQSRILREHENAQPLAAGGAEDSRELAINKELKSESSVRMIQLFFNKENIADFVNKTKALGALFPDLDTNNQNVTGFVEAVINRAYDEWLTPATDNVLLPSAE